MRAIFAGDDTVGTTKAVGGGNILILGAGGIGGYFGAHLIRAGANVTYLLREQRKARIEEGQVEDVFPYPQDIRFIHQEAGGTDAVPAAKAA